MGLFSKQSKKHRQIQEEYKGEEGVEEEEEEVEEGGDEEEEADTDESLSGSECEGNLESEEDEEEATEREHEKNEIGGDAEMEELEKQYLDIRQEEQALLKNLNRHKDEDRLKGQAVKNQKAIWDKNLEFRFLLQKAFSSSNKLPQEPLRSSFCNSDKAVDQAYSDLISSSEKTLSSFLELQEALTESNPSIAKVTDDVSDDLELGTDKDWLQIHRMQRRVAPFRNSSIDKWQRKTQVTSGAAAFKGKLHAFNQSISEQVAAYMRDPSRMVKRMQLRRCTIGIFGEVVKESGTADKKGENMDGDPELIDDSEFYQQLLKEFFENCDLTSSETTFYALKKLQTKKRKIVDRRASKSRKIRYNVHEKIANFMAPVPMVLPPMAPKLFENLFGLQNQKSASIA